MERTKAEFRALREMVGLTQEEMAETMSVQPRAVRRWGSEKAPEYRPPADAWRLLDHYRRLQDEVILAATDKVVAIADEMGGYPEEIVLPYWSSQADYEAHHVADDGGSWRMANATARAVAACMIDRNIAVRWVRGEDNIVQNSEIHGF